MDETAIQYVSDADGQATGVIVPIAIWQELTSEKETAYLLKDEAMKRRLLEARNRNGGIPFEVAREKLGI
jgi:PHD/YefM family antitoxin component YafN of YafNO toxin-antitoxin module